MKDKVLFKITRTFDSRVLGDEVGSKFIITAEVSAIGEQSPYFSVTCEGRNCGGCMHREAVMCWPDIKPIVDLHLCTYPDGAPSHNGGNAWYYMSGALGGAGERYHAGNSERAFDNPDGSRADYRKPTPDECLESFAEYVRVSLDDARILRHELVALIDRHPDTVGYKKACMKAEARCMLFLDAQRPRWAKEAEAAMELMKELAKQHPLASDAENKAAIQRQRDAEKAVKSGTLAGIPAPRQGAEFKLDEVREIVLPHPFHITNKHMNNSNGILNPDVAPCGYPGCTLRSSEHVKQKTLFITVKDNTDLNAVPGLVTYLNTIKPAAEALGIQGFAFPKA